MLVLAAMVFICLSIAGAPEARAEGESIVMSQDGRISMDLVDARLDAVLSDLSKKAPLQVKGRPGGSDRLTVHFSGLTLEEALHKLMAGYNYALFLPPKGHKGTATLTIVGKAVPGATVSPAETAAAPVSSPPAEQQPSARPPRHGAGAPPASSEQPAQTTAASAQPAPAAQSAPAAPPPSPTAPEQPVIRPPPPEQPITPPAEPGQQQATSQAVQPDATAAATPPGVLPAPDSQPEFNPAAWGGKGRRQ
jgi:hypothetical protein